MRREVTRPDETQSQRLSFPAPTLMVVKPRVYWHIPRCRISSLWGKRDHREFNNNNTAILWCKDAKTPGCVECVLWERPNSVFLVRLFFCSISADGINVEVISGRKQTARAVKNISSSQRHVCNVTCREYNMQATLSISAVFKGQRSRHNGDWYNY